MMAPVQTYLDDDMPEMDPWKVKTGRKAAL